MLDRGNAYGGVGGEKYHCGRQRHRSEGNIKMDMQEMGGGGPGARLMWHMGGTTGGS